MATINGLILYDSLGKTDPHYGQNDEVDGAYTQASCTGDSTLYVVYSEPNLAGACTTVETTAVVNFGQPIRSFQGYDKKGIILFTNTNYGGQAELFKQSDTNIKDAFPTGQYNGVSSFIVRSGKWALYSKENYGGTRLTLQGRDTFGPYEEMSYLGPANDQVASIKLL